MTRVQALAVAFAAGRGAFGAALCAAPERVASGWLGGDADSVPTQIAIRGVGARDLALAGGTVAAATTGQGLTGWLAASLGADVGDIVSTLLADGDRLPKNAKSGTVALAGASVAAGAALIAVLESS
jgi:hypothetical protein